MLKTGLAALAVAMMAGTTMAETPKAPWDSDILPPTLAWHGASEKLVAKPSDPWITPSELTGLTASPNYEETRAWLEKLAAASPLIRIETFGKSPEGRDLLVLYVSKDGDKFDPRKPVLLAQAGIHPGEIDGKDAGMMLLRDMAFHGKDALLDKVNLVFVPIFSVDGHERASPYSRPNQRGPVIQGWRHTAQNLNLNRDYGKLDAPEMRAMIGLINKVRPDLYMDIHVTDGEDYQYDVTYGWAGYLGDFARSKATSAWLDNTYLPATQAGLKAAGHVPGQLVFALDDRDPKKGLGSSPASLRYSNGYGDAVGMATVLVENHSLKPYRQRVLGTYVLLEESLKVLARDGAALRAAETADRAQRPTVVEANFGTGFGKGGGDKPLRTVSFLGVRYETYDSPATGGKEVRWLGKPDPKPWSLPLFAAEPSLRLTPPKAYWISSAKPDVIERLRVHGVQMETLAAPKTVSVDMIRFTSPKIATRASEGHVEIDAGPVTHETRSVTWPVGSVRVSTDQPLGELVTLLLEPESDESFFAWGMFPEVLQRVEYIEGYALAPLAEKMLAADPKLKAEFEAKLAADPKFAADPDARLGWFYARTPYYDDHYKLYPIGREL
ncbi:M14 family metallopeptidase [Caulobacter sp. CCG-8]|uniref:M14 family metallopeptidase n=1 Tax=Caulobacter sp. CCG-8 TaxID=3127958 RepID=UPI00307D1154